MLIVQIARVGGKIVGRLGVQVVPRRGVVVGVGRHWLVRGVKSVLMVRLRRKSSRGVLLTHVPMKPVVLGIVWGRHAHCDQFGVITVR